MSPGWLTLAICDHSKIVYEMTRVKKIRLKEVKSKLVRLQKISFLYIISVFSFCYNSVAFLNLPNKADKCDPMKCFRARE